MQILLTKIFKEVIRKGRKIVTFDSSVKRTGFDIVATCNMYGRYSNENYKLKITLFVQVDIQEKLYPHIFK